MRVRINKKELAKLKRELINRKTKWYISENENENNLNNSRLREAYCYLLNLNNFDKALEKIENEFKNATFHKIKITREDIEEYSHKFAKEYTPFFASNVFEVYARYPILFSFANEMQELNHYPDIRDTAQAGVYNFIYTMTLFILIVILEVD